jgi:predicted metal-dependent peptidase
MNLLDNPPFPVINTNNSRSIETQIDQGAKSLSPEEKETYKKKLRTQMSYVMDRAKQYLHSKATTQFIANAIASYPNIYTFDRRVSTGATDGKKMMFNIPFILSFYQPDEGERGFRDVAAVAFVIAHEILHAQLGHFTRDASIKDPTDKVAKTRLNYALDHEINCLLVGLGMSCPSNLILYYLPTIPYPNMDVTGADLFNKPNAEYVYAALRKAPDECFEDDESRHDEDKESDLDEEDEDIDSSNEDQEDKEDKKDEKKGNKPPKGKPKEKKGPKQDGNENQKPISGGTDEKEESKEDDKKEKTSGGSGGVSSFKDPIVSKMLDEIAKQKKDIVENMDRRMQVESDANATRQKIIEALSRVNSEYAKSLVNMISAQMSQTSRASGFWKRTLRMFVRNTNLKDVSWNRLSRRFIPYRIYIPKEKDFRLSISIGFDVSGSMNIEDMKAFMLEIEKIMKSFSKNYRIIIHLFSEKVHKKFSTVFDRKNPYTAAAFEALVKKGQAEAEGTDFDDIITTIAMDCRDPKYLSMGGIIFTDGYGYAKAYPSPPSKVKIIWCLVAGSDLTDVLPGINWGLRIIFDKN